MKLNTKAFHYLSPEDWRVLTAVETGTKNHEVVPTKLIDQLSGLRSGSNGANKSISTLAKADLIAKVKNAKYDGYRLTYGGLDYLALHAHTKSSSIIQLGSQMGVGKESDIYLVTSPATPLSGSHNSRKSALASQSASPPVQSILKIHRLGRTSFRSLTRNRAYQGNRQHCSWQQLSRLSAQKEFTAMTALYEAGFPVPRPIAWNRHTVVMSLVPGIPLRQVSSSAFGRDGTEQQAESVALLYGECMEMTLRLAQVGCIHGDYNEFNILIENVPDPDDEDETRDELQHDSHVPSSLDTPLAKSQPNLSSKSQTPSKQLIPHIIDFPQITSLSHPNASSYYARDVECIKSFFQKKYHFVSEDPAPTFEDAQARLNEAEKRRMEKAKREDAASRADRDLYVETESLAGTDSVAASPRRPHTSSRRIDVVIAAAGFSKKMARELEGYFERQEGAAAEQEDADSPGEDGTGDECAVDVLEDERRAETNEDSTTGQGALAEGTINELSPLELLPAGNRLTAMSSTVLHDLTPENLTSLGNDGGIQSPLGDLSITSSLRPSATSKAIAGWSI